MAVLSNIMDGFANFSKKVVASNGRLFFFFVPTFLDADSIDCEVLYS